MAASYKTVQKVIEVVERYVDDQTLEKIILDLEKVDGNQSFRDTVKRMKSHYLRGNK